MKITLKEKTIKYLENIKKRAEKIVSDYPICKRCGKEIKIEANPIFDLGKKVNMEDGIFYLCKEEGYYYICDNCEEKQKGGEFRDNNSKPETER